MSALPLESGFIYGPIFSRRLGLSLGLNLLPPRAKVCSFDCVYCHDGPTGIKTRAPQGVDFPAVARVLQAVESALRGQLHFAAITFSGNGEPTLHPNFADIAVGVHQLRDRLRPDVKLALFSNATTLGKGTVRAALTYFDLPIFKLDVGDAATLAKLNRPAPEVTLVDIVAGLKQVPHLILQSVLIDGAVANVSGDAYAVWLAALADVRPVQVQLYSTDYSTPESGVARVPPYALKHIAAEVAERTGANVGVYWVDGEWKTEKRRGDNERSS
ncbi:MAG TPA: hypothetical protein PKH77_05705 [Anaerolineae bacterium]|nr:hypothetical protein [Anaerolineae bacterium]